MTLDQKVIFIFIWSVEKMYPNDSNLVCQGPTLAQIHFYINFSWWLEGFCQILVGSLGFLANILGAIYKYLTVSISETCFTK